MKKDKVRIAIVENSFAVGGVQRLALDQLETIDRNEFEVLLVVLTQSDQNNFYELIPDDVQVEKLNFSGLGDIKSWFNLLSILRGFKPQVVKSSLYLSNTIVRVLKPLVGYKVIAAEHNTNDGKSGVQKFINRLLNKLSYTTIVDSQMVAEYLSDAEKTSIDRYTVIHNGVEVNKIKAFRDEYGHLRDSYRKEYGIQSDEVLFFTIGRLIKQKNHVRMVQAFALFIQNHPKAKLLIIGDGGLKIDIESEIAKHGLEDKVILLSARTEIKKYYLMSDFTLLSSNHEGFCIAAMEGLAFGNPLVSTRVAGVSEYLEDGVNGFFAEKTPESLAEKMEKIVCLSPEQLEKFRQASVATSLNYSVEIYGEKFSGLIKQTIGK